MAGTVLVRVISDTTKATKGLDDVSDSAEALGEKFDAIGGGFAQLSGGLGDLGGSLSMIGEKAKIPALAGLGSIMEQTAPLVMGVTGAMDLMRLGVDQAQKVLGYMSKAQAALNLVMSLNPIFLVVLAIVALVAIFVIAYKKSETFREIVDAAFQGIKNAALTVFNFLKGYFLTIFNAYKKLFSDVGEFLSSAWDFLKALPGKVIGWLGKILDWFEELPGKIGGFLSSIPAKMLQIGKDIVQGILDGLQWGIDKVKQLAQKIADAIPGPIKKFLGISSPSKVMKDIGKDAITGLNVGMENAIPKIEGTVNDVAETIADLSASPSIALTATGVTSGGQGVAAANVYQITINPPPTMDAAEIGRQTVKAIKDYERSVGRTYLVA